MTKKTAPAETEDKEASQALATKMRRWIYKGDYPTRAAGTLVYPGGSVYSEKKPGKNFKKA